LGNRSGKRFHDHHKKILERIDGNHCLICKGNGVTRAPPDWELELHHARTDLTDSDEAYWAYEATCLLCQPCNLSLRRKKVEELMFIIRFYRAQNGGEREREREGTGTYRRKENILDQVDVSHSSGELQLKARYEPEFERFVWERISEFGSFNESELLDQFFQKTKASQNTTKRYLNGYCSATGDYRRTKIDGVWTITFKYPVKPSKKRHNAPRPVENKNKEEGDSGISLADSQGTKKNDHGK
jgi:hypothetical protein